MSEECEHGTLKRKCLPCQLLEEIEELKARLIVTIDPDEFARRHSELLHENEQIRKRHAACIKKHEELRARVQRDECVVFVQHIEDHLEPGQEVICKICGKTIAEIFDEGSE